MSAVEARGEVSITLDTEYVLRPSREALNAIQVQTSKGLLRLAREAIAMDLSLTEVAIVVAECIKAQGKKEDLASLRGVRSETIETLILGAEGGFAAALGTVTGLLAGACSGGFDAEGEVKAPARTTETSTGA